MHVVYIIFEKCQTAILIKCVNTCTHQTVLDWTRSYFSPTVKHVHVTSTRVAVFVAFKKIFLLQDNGH